jgi:hypothetical protein
MGLHDEIQSVPEDYVGVRIELKDATFEVSFQVILAAI